MTLSSIANPASASIRGVRFVMLDSPMFVTVVVTYAALDGIEIALATSGSYLARFEKHRGRLEQIANSKHQRGNIEDDGSVVVQAIDLQVV